MLYLLNQEHRQSDKVRKYEGYPLELALLNTRGVVASPTNVEPVIVSIDYEKPTQYSTRYDHHVVALPADAGCVYIEAVSGDNLVQVDIVSTCVPESPYYVRWINSIAGYEYAMFSAERTESLAVTGRVNLQREAAPGVASQAMVSASAVRSQTIVAEQLSADEFERLSGLLVAPVVEVYSTVTKSWLPLIITEDATATKSITTPLQNLTLVVQGPRVLTQF